MSFTWDNVYTYDHEFQRCGIILQQAWSICLKDKISHHGMGGAGSGKFSKNKKEICQRFNKGLCMAGRSCKFDHRCLGCGKFGHGINICRNWPAADANLGKTTPDGQNGQSNWGAAATSSNTQNRQ